MTITRENIKRTERGWAGHFIAGHRCQFRRNTLLEFGEVRVVVSTIGVMLIDEDAAPVEIGLNRHYETMVFMAKWENPYWEADVEKQITVDGKWSIPNVDRGTDLVANNMHEVICDAIFMKMKNGEIEIACP